MLTRTHRTFHYRISDLQMRRIEGQREVHRPTRRADVGGETLMVFHIARSEMFKVNTFKLGE